MPAIAEHLRLTGFDPRTVVIGPDEESRPWVTELAGRLGVTYTVARKLRRADRSVEITLTEPAAVTGRPALLVDDIVSSGGTLMTCARMLTAAGADRIDAVVTHALFPPALLNELASAGIRSVRSTDSVPHPTNAIRLDGVLADALRNECRASAAEARVP
jgi:ribose-phosphate pyrophosphokinase